MNYESWTVNLNFSVILSGSEESFETLGVIFIIHAASRDPSLRYRFAQDDKIGGIEALAIINNSYAKY